MRLRIGWFGQGSEIEWDDSPWPWKWTERVPVHEMDPCGECPIGTCDHCEQCNFSEQFAEPPVSARPTDDE